MIELIQCYIYVIGEFYTTYNALIITITSGTQGAPRSGWGWVAFCQGTDQAAHEGCTQTPDPLYRLGHCTQKQQWHTGNKI